MAKKPKGGGERGRNPVARHAPQFNRSAAFKDRTQYRRTAKHKGREPYANPPALAVAGLRKVPATLGWV